MVQEIHLAVDIGGSGPVRPANRILLGLPAPEFARLEPRLERVVLPQNTVLQPADEEIEHVFFPVRGVASLMVTGPEGEQVDTAIVGNEGMVGLPVFLGTGRMPVMAVVQVDMEAQRLAVADLRAELERGGQLVNLLQRYTQMVLVELAQLILCNRAHSLERRAARWILQMNDRMSVGAPLAITQDFLASMLGANRPKVTAALQSLRAAGLVSYTRGNLQVGDASELEANACTCYRTIRDELDRLLSTTERYDITAGR
jgi:CRP-like cAMP-binding protein